MRAHADVRIRLGLARHAPALDSPGKFLHSESCHPCVVQVLAVHDLPPKVHLPKDSHSPASSQEDARSGDYTLAQGSEEDEEVERTESRVDTLPRSQGLSTPSLANAICASIRARHLKVAGILVTRSGHGRSIGHSADTPTVYARICRIPRAGEGASFRRLCPERE